MKTTVECPMHRYDGELYFVEPSGVTLSKEVETWLCEEIGARGLAWAWPTYAEFVFSNEADAMAFKLRWL